MPAQKESHIDDYAYDYLRSYYVQRYGSKDILLDRALKTKHGHHTDGLFSFKRQDHHLFVASLHTSHSVKIAQMLQCYKKKGLSKVRYFTLLLVLITTFLGGWQFSHWAVRFILPFALAGGFFLLHTLLEERLLRRKLVALLDVMLKAPADEKWLGLSLSSLVLRNNSLGSFLAACKLRGIGVITVGKRAKVVLVQDPKTIVCRQGDFLSHYSAEARIRKALMKDAYLRVA